MPSNGGQAGGPDCVTSLQTTLSQATAGGAVNAKRLCSFNIRLAWSLYHPKVPEKSRGSACGVHTSVGRMSLPGGSKGLGAERMKLVSPPRPQPTQTESVVVSSRKRMSSEG